MFTEAIANQNKNIITVEKEALQEKTNRLTAALLITEPA